jgi:hypothetical protein
MPEVTDSILVLQIASDAARDIVFGESDEFTLVEHEILDQRRWTTHHRGVFKMGSDTYWQVDWSAGSTESQEIRPFEDVEYAKFYRVVPVEKTVTVYVRVKDSQ